MQELPGGRDGIYKSGNSVLRPLHPWSSTIHRLLNHLEQEGFDKSPRFLGIENDQERVTFVEGETYDYPLEGPIGTESALISAAKILRELHDSSESFLESDSEEQSWMFPAREPQEVICHGDFTPYNMALQGDEVVGVFDFDVSHPAPRIWDLAFSTYTWAPFMTNPGCAKGKLDDQICRAKLFCDSYGATAEHREQLVPTVVERLEQVVAFMVSEAEKGDPKFRKDVEEGHHKSYLNDIKYLKMHQETITTGIM